MRKKTISIRVKEADWAKINKRCKAAHTTMANFAKLAILQMAVDDPRQLLDEVHKIKASDIMAYTIKTTPVTKKAINVSEMQQLVNVVKYCIDTMNDLQYNINKIPFQDGTDLDLVYYSIKDYLSELHHLIEDLEVLIRESKVR